MNASPQGTVVVFDYNWSGHIPAYHRLIVESLLEMGWRVVSLSGRPDEVQQHIVRHAPGAQSRLLAPHCPALGRPPARQNRLGFLSRLPGGHALWSRIRTNPALRRRHALARWATCRAELALLPEVWEPQLVLFPYLDDMFEPALSPAQLDFERPWMGLHVSASDLREPRLASEMNARLRLLQHPHNRGLFVLDRVAEEQVQSMMPARVVRTLPDMADQAVAEADCPLARQVRQRARGRKIISLLGHLSIAKNIEQFLDLGDDPANQDLFFLLAGQFEPLGVPPRLRRRIQAAAEDRGQNVWAIPERIPSEEVFNRLLQDSDLLFAVYRSFTRSSNILSKAALFCRPVVVAEGYCMAERTAAYNLGLAVPENNPAATIAAIRRLLDTPNQGDYARFMQDFSRAEFARRLDQALHQALSPHLSSHA
jgi:hypothetical protein